MLAWTDAGYLLTLPPGALDLDLYERELGRARAARAAGHLGEAAEALRAALRLWRGPVNHSEGTWTTMASWVDRAITTTASVSGEGFSSRCGTWGGTHT